ncbi:MAG: 3-methyladenine DNA glycosylase [Chloroflexi bacterium]|nr:3-methyladenine DNA glycosylase [Chloroflexota bacterium]
MPGFTLTTPPNFRFWSTVVSHGWCDLPPYTCDETTRTLTRIHQLGDGAVVKLVLRDADAQPGSLLVHVEGIDALQPEQIEDISHALRASLGIERDMSRFYETMRSYPRYQWIEPLGAGRLLASPTTWEDAVKTLFTTNTTWRMTIQMTERVVTLGESYAGGGHAFPTPQRLAAMPAAELNAHVRAGYRGDYLHLLATRITNGDLEIESWRNAALTSDEVYKRIKAVKGFGDYAAGTLLKLLGHFDRLATDSVCRTVYKDAINNGIAAAHDKEIAAYYQPFGAWQGLVQWMDVMEDYFKASAFATPAPQQP